MIRCLLGRVGQLRICYRRDIDPGSYGRCTVEEIPMVQPSGGDVLLICKRYMADAEPYKVVTAVSAAEVELIQRSFAQPTGTWKRRVIAPKVRKGVLATAPSCVRQGVLSVAAAGYLTNWVEGTLPRRTRPRQYSFLSHRLNHEAGGEGAMPWGARLRNRHIDLKIDDVASDDSADSKAAYEPIEGDDA